MGHGVGRAAVRITVVVLTAALLVVAPAAAAATPPSDPQGTTTRLTSLPLAIGVESDPTPVDWGAADPALSADGRFVAFDAVAPMGAATDVATGSHVYIVDRSGAAPVTRSLGGPDPLYGVDPAISRDGGLIAYRDATPVSSGAPPSQPTVQLCVRSDVTPAAIQCALAPRSPGWPIDPQASPALAADGATLAWQQPPPAPPPPAPTPPRAQLQPAPVAPQQPAPVAPQQPAPVAPQQPAVPAPPAPQQQPGPTSSTATSSTAPPSEGLPPVQQPLALLAVAVPAPPVGLVAAAHLAGDGRPVGTPAVISARLPDAPGQAPVAEVRPHLSADGTRMVVVATYGGRTAVVGVALTGDLTRPLPAVRLDNGVTGTDGSTETAISGDGGTVAFTANGSVWTTRWPASGAPGIAAAASVTGTATPRSGWDPSLSADGRYLAFVTADADRNGVYNAFDPACNTRCGVAVVRDLQIQLPFPAELASPLTDAAALADTPVISGDGSQVVFASASSQLSTGDQNEAADLFVRTLGSTVRVSPVDFGSTPAGGQSVTRTATVTRTGIGPRALGLARVEGPNAADFAVKGRSCDGTERPEGDGCTLTVAFHSTTPGTESARLVVATVGGADVTAPLTATATAVPRVAVTPASLDLGMIPVNVQTDNKVIDVRSVGTADVTAHAGALSSGFLLQKDGCAHSVLRPGTACQITVAGDPAALGPITGTLEIASNAEGSPAKVSLVVRGVVTQLAANPPVIAPGRVTAVAGSGFPPNTVATLTGVAGLPASAQVDGSGRFAVPFVVPDDSLEGPVVLHAVASATDESRVAADGNLLIVPGTLVAPDFISRH